MRTPPTFDVLERRRLLATAVATLSSRGTLGVTGTGAADVITVAADSTGANIVVTLNGSSESFPSADVRRLYVDAAGGEDAVTVNVARRAGATLLGSAGNDTLTGASRGEFLNGGDGDDVLNGSAGDDTLNGEAGDDTLTGGDGRDTAEYADRDRGFDFSFPPGATYDPDLYPTEPATAVGVAEDTSGSEHDVLQDLIERIGGSEFGDGIITGSFGLDFDTNSLDFGNFEIEFLGRGGGDFVGGLDGALIWVTTFRGGPGSDGVSYGLNGGVGMFYGEDGDDSAYCEDVGAPGFDGGPGVDEISGDIEIATEREIDLREFPNVENAELPYGRLIGNDLPNRLTVTSDSGSIIGGGGDDTIVGDWGNDTLEGGTGNDRISGNGGDDVLAGNGGADVIHGGDGNDTIVGGRGRDRLYGEAGDDQILARDRARDTLYGGDDTDEATVDDSDTVKDLWGEIETLL
jgi:Ca2+-binding RTX toxin-like protein